MASGSIPVDFFDCDNGFRKYSSGFLLSVMVFELILIGVTLVEEKALVNLLVVISCCVLVTLFIYSSY
jgi:hypothetical protein